MDQRVDLPSQEDLQQIEAQRTWVRGHFEPSSQHKYGVLTEKLRLIQAILDAGWIEPNETVKLQRLGIAFGDALAQGIGMEWVMVEDEFGRDPALRRPGTTVIVFPMTMISKRIERGDKVNVTELFEDVSAKVHEMANSSAYRLN